jgi:hypothetical protein
MKWIWYEGALRISTRQTRRMSLNHALEAKNLILPIAKRSRVQFALYRQDPYLNQPRFSPTCRLSVSGEVRTAAAVTLSKTGVRLAHGRAFPARNLHSHSVLPDSRIKGSRWI